MLKKPIWNTIETTLFYYYSDYSTSPQVWTQVRIRFSLTWQLQHRSGSNIFKLFLHSRCKYLGFSHSSFLWKEQKNQWIKEDKEKYAMLSKFYLWQFLKVKIVLGTQPFVSITWWCLRLTEGSHISSQALLNPENNSILTKVSQIILSTKYRSDLEATELFWD